MWCRCSAAHHYPYDYSSDASTLKEYESALDNFIFVIYKAEASRAFMTREAPARPRDQQKRQDVSCRDTYV